MPGTRSHPIPADNNIHVTNPVPDPAYENTANHIRNPSNQAAHPSIPIIPHQTTFVQPSVIPHPANQPITSNDLFTFMTNQQNDYQNQMRKQAAYYAKQQSDLMNHFITMIQTSASPSPTRPTDRQESHVKLANPESFEGSLNDSNSFLNSLENIFEARPNAFPTVADQIQYACSFIKGKASKWREQTLSEFNKGTIIFSSWNDFETHFRATYGNPHAKEEGQRRLMSMQQGSLTAEEFFIDFQEAKTEANMCDETVIFALKKAIRPNLLNEVLRHDPIPTSYVGWKTAILRADQNSRNAAATRSHNISLSTSTFPSKPRQYSNFRLRHPLNDNSNNAIHPIPSTSSHATIASPSIVPNSTATANSRTRPFTSYRTRKCWKCGKEGAHECTGPPKSDRARALLEKLATIDNVYDHLHEESDSIRLLLESPDPEIVDDEEYLTIFNRMKDVFPGFLETDE